jgi:3-oxoacyl-[acyl-carrier-protein] synthase-3
MFDRHGIGIAAVGTYTPSGVRTAEEIAEQSGHPIEMIRDRVGIDRIHVAADDEHPSEMAIHAARGALEKSGVDPARIGALVYTCAGLADAQVWSPAARVMDALEIRNGFGFEVRNNCAAANVGATVAAGLMERDPDVDAAIVVAADRMSMLADYTNPDLHLFYTLGDGASAAVLRRNEPTNRVLGFAEHTDPSLNDAVVLWGGTRMRPDGPNDPTSAKLTLPDPADFTMRLSAGYVENYAHAVERALEHAGRTASDVDLVVINQLKPSLRDAIMDRLGIARDNAVVFIQEYGHLGPADVWFGLDLALRSDRIEPGALVLLASSGLGASWAATVVEFRGIPPH